MEKSLVASIVVLVLINVTDSITNSVVAPSLLFYVTDMGGTKEQYGMITSAAYFSGLVMMSYYGAWVDGNGNKYGAPYAASFTLGIAGSLIYFMAIVFPMGRVAIGAIFVGRFITGMGAAGRSLAYSWIATAIPREDQRTTLTIMSMTRIIGMMLGPPINLLVAEVDAVWVISSRLGAVVPVNQNNSVGLIVAFTEMVLFVAARLFLKDPPPKDGGGGASSGGAKPKQADLRQIWRCITFEMFLCPLNFFVVMINFTFYSVALPPVGFHAFGWTPVQISGVMAAQAVVLFVGMCASMAISMTKAPDMLLIGFGNMFFVIGGVITYFSWTIDSTPLQFLLPILIVSVSFPFIGPANRSKYTKAVHSCPELENSHGIMQSFLNQAFMIGGFIGPNFVTAFVLRNLENIDASGSSHELTPWAWYIPISSMIVIIGLIYEDVILGKNELDLNEYESEGTTTDIDEAPVTETSNLMVEGRRGSSKRRRSSLVEINQNFSGQYEVARRSSCEAIGIANPFETRDEIKLRDLLLEDKKEWEDLQMEGMD